MTDDFDDDPETVEELLEEFIGEEILGIEIDADEEELIIILEDQAIVIGGEGLYVRRLSPDKEFLH